MSDPEIRKKKGLVPEEWKIDIISNHVKIISGGTPKTKNEEYWNGTIPWISIVDFVGDKRWISKTEKCITQKGLENSPTKLLHTGQIIISARGTVGELAQIKGDMAFNQSCYGLDGKNTLDNTFLFYLLKYKLEEIRQKGHGAVFNTITRQTFNQILVPLPEKDEQKAIAKILLDIDLKIDLNRQINVVLEELANSLFRFWFVDFEFPNQEGKPYKTTGGKMKYSKELDKNIPEKWEVKKLGTFIDLDKGLSYKGAHLSDQGVPMVNLGTIAPRAGFIHDGIKYYTGEHKEKHLVKVGDVVIANTDITQKREVLGSPAIVPPNLNCEKALFTHHIFAVRKKAYLPNLFIYYLLQLQAYRDRVIGFATGTTVLALPRDAILDFEFVAPDEYCLREFERTASLLMAKINNNIEQNIILALLRDILLPKLMSGKIRVPITAENKEAV